MIIVLLLLMLLLLLIFVYLHCAAQLFRVHTPAGI